MKKSLPKILFALIVGVIAAIVLTVMFSKQSPRQGTIKIGYLNTMTGPASPIGVRYRNAITHLVEKKNAEGGINGRLIELIYKDDKANKDLAKQKAEELLNEGVVALFGPYLSTTSAAVLPAVNTKQRTMISMGTTSHELSKKDDSLLRVTMPTDRKAPIYAYLCYHKLGLKNLVVVTDASNPKFTNSFHDHFKKALEKFGGKVSNWVTFSAKKPYSAADIADKINATGADGMMMVTNSSDGALICQHLRKVNKKMKIIAHSWATSGQNFITSGGRAVEGVYSISDFYGGNPGKNFKQFEAAIKKRYGNELNEPEQSGYEAAQMLFYALSQTDDPLKIKQAILDKGTFAGLDNEIKIDKYGDTSRKTFVVQVKKGKLSPTEEINQSEIEQHD